MTVQWTAQHTLRWEPRLQCDICKVLSIRHLLNTSSVCFVISFSSCLSLFPPPSFAFFRVNFSFKELKEGGQKNQIKAKWLVTATARRFQFNYPEILTDACIHSATGVRKTSDNIQASSVRPTFSSSPKVVWWGSRGIRFEQVVQSLTCFHYSQTSAWTGYCPGWTTALRLKSLLQRRPMTASQKDINANGCFESVTSFECSRIGFSTLNFKIKNVAESCFILYLEHCLKLPKIIFERHT